MTSPWRHSRGGWYVCVVLASKRRAQIYLGKITKAQAVTISGHIEQLRLANERGVEPPSDTLAWSARISAKMRAKLQELGLIRTVAVRVDWRLDEWFDEYLESRKDYSESTRKGFKTAKNAAVLGLGNRILSEITVAEARQYARNMASSYSSEHASKLVERVKQVLENAKESRILAENPFSDVALQSKPDEERKFYLDRATSKAVLSHCPHVHAAAVFALARWGGLRIPHEPLAIEWQHVDFGSRQLYIPADTKTGARIVPLFPEVLEQLQLLRKETPQDQIALIDRARASAGTTWRNWLETAIQKAGLSGWPKLWVNLRASCRTDLEDRFPAHVCDAWLGHSTKVAKKHYLQVTPEHWEAAHGAQ